MTAVNEMNGVCLLSDRLIVHRFMTGCKDTVRRKDDDIHSLCNTRRHCLLRIICHPQNVDHN